MGTIRNNKTVLFVRGVCTGPYVHARVAKKKKRHATFERGDGLFSNGGGSEID